ncbi:hypothetical protein [Salmonella phage SE4]|uniref:hypothetical protein n=1 Tax=Salmonella phage SE4 TaxID=2575328 RepID=UPI0011D2DB99|nr:hypothetical protein HWC20_gp13 [Salmonella phage SE4]QEG07739.1 hypothetical protein [Salmonella phage SE4]
MFNLSRIRRALFGPTAFERKYEAAIARLEQVAMSASSVGKSINYQGKAPAHFSAGIPILDLKVHPFNASHWWSSFEMAEFFSRPQPEVTHVELSHMIGKGVCVKLSLDTNGPLKPGRYTARINEVQHITKQGTKAMTKVFDKNGKAHDAVNFVICVDEGNTRLLTQGKVYANLGGTDNAYENIWVIDDRGLKQNFSTTRFQQFKSEKQNWGIACKQYANLNIGKVYNIEKNRPGVRSLEGTRQIACVDETGNWLTYNEDVFSAIKPIFSEQYLTSKLMSAQKLATHTHSEPVSINLTPDIADDKLKYVGVKFEPTGRVYTYKYIGKVKVGDKAVVDVRNSNYPELTGTKLVDVVSVSEANSSGFNSATLKWIVSVPDFEKYERRQQAEQLLREASARLDLEVQAELDRRKQSVVAELAQSNPEIASLLQGIAALKDQLQ